MIEIIIRHFLGLIKLLIDQLGNNDVQCVVTVQIERLITKEEKTENNIKRASSPTPSPGRGKELGREAAFFYYFKSNSSST